MGLLGPAKLVVEKFFVTTSPANFVHSTFTSNVLIVFPLRNTASMSMSSYVWIRFCHWAANAAALPPGMEPRAMDEGQRKMKQLFKDSGISPFTPIKGIFIQGPVFMSFFMNITNMVEKVPSFKEGGAFSFLDLSTPDPCYALPILTGLTFLITVEALFCYWITSNVFLLVYGLVNKRHDVKKKFLGIPDMPPPPPAFLRQSAFSVFSQLKKLTSLNENPTPTLAPSPKLAVDRKVSSQSVLSQRLKTLEKEVKGRKKNRKRCILCTMLD